MKIKLLLENHPATGGQPSANQLDQLERQIWTELAEGGLLVTMGWYFNSFELKGKGHFRIAFSYTEVWKLQHPR
jgi:aromatic amino acid aminotransferase I